MTEYLLKWTTPGGRNMSLGWYDYNDHCMVYLLEVLRADGATITTAEVKSSITTNLLAEPESRPAHPPT